MGCVRWKNEKWKLAELSAVIAREPVGIEYLNKMLEFDVDLLYIFLSKNAFNQSESSF